MWTYVILFFVIAAIVAASLWVAGVFGSTPPVSSFDNRELSDDMPELVEDQVPSRWEAPPGSDGQVFKVPVSTNLGRFSHLNDDLVVYGDKQIFAYRWNQTTWLETFHEEYEHTPLGVILSAAYMLVCTPTDVKCYARHGQRWEASGTLDIPELNGHGILHEDIAYLALEGGGYCVVDMESREVSDEYPGDEVWCMHVQHDQVLIGTLGGVFDAKDQEMVFEKGCTSMCGTDDLLFLGNEMEETVDVYSLGEIRPQHLKTIEIPGSQMMLDNVTGFGASVAYVKDKSALLVSAPYDNAQAPEGGIGVLYHVDSNGTVTPQDVLMSPKPVEQGHFGITLSTHRNHWLISQDRNQTDQGVCVRIPIA